MKTPLAAALVILSTLVHTPAAAQSTDTAAQRGRLAEQRIQIEAERRAREEEERQQQGAEQARAEEQAAARADAERTREQSQQPTLTIEDETSTRAASEANAARSTPPAGNADLSRTLEQLRTLGELRDAGYVTEEEFQRIKRKILDSQ